MFFFSVLPFFAGIATFFAQLITLCYYCCCCYCFCCFLFSAKLLHSVLACLLFQCTRRDALYTLFSRLNVRVLRLPGAWRYATVLFFAHVLPRLVLDELVCLSVCLFVCQFVGCRLSVAYCCMQMLARSSQLAVRRQRRRGSPLVTP